MSISFDNSENNKKETLARIKKIVISCFEDVEHRPSFEFFDSYNFFSNPGNTCLDYLTLLAKIKKSFGFAINDRYIAGETTVDGFCAGILKAQEDIENERAMGRFNPDGRIVISDKSRISMKPFRRSHFIKITSEVNDFHFISEAKKYLDRDKIVLFMPSSIDEMACIVYLALQSNVPIISFKSRVPASAPIDVRSYYDSTYNEKTNLKNIAEIFNTFMYN